MRGQDTCRCGKIKFPSKQAAWAAIDSLHRHRRVRPESMAVYWCPIDSSWHLRSDLKFGRWKRKKRQ